MGRFFSFIATFCVLFGLTLAFLSMVDALPEPAGTGITPQPNVQTVPVNQVEAPARIVAKDVDLDVVILNPDSTDLKVLDAALLKGSIHYPTSALLGEEGSVLLFGHSSSIPVVRNHNYKAFNNIQKLKPGAVISVYSASTEYRYAVTGVSQRNINEDPIVPLRTKGYELILITCNSSFATKSDRYM